MGAVKVLRPRQDKYHKFDPIHTTMSADDFKALVNESDWRSKQAAIRRYRQLSISDPGAAERFLSTHFQLKPQFTIALVDDCTGQPLDEPSMIDKIIQCLLDRANNDSEYDRSEELLMQRQVSIIRQQGACPSCRHAGCNCPHMDLYSDAEIDTAIMRLDVSKRCIKLPYAAVKATDP
eukprot:6958118-Karenia_brevis.AAC.1